MGLANRDQSDPPENVDINRSPTTISRINCAAIKLIANITRAKRTNRWPGWN
jgi:hypothetical protein